MFELNPTILVALVGLVGTVMTAAATIIVALIQLHKRERHLRSTAEKELRFQSAALSFTDLASEWSQISDEVQLILDETEIDRILLLRAWNGPIDPRWATAVCQWRLGNQKLVVYNHVELDVDYINKIKTIVNGGQVMIDVENERDSLIVDIYKSEGIKYSFWSFIGRTELIGEDENARITYMSFATHNDAPIEHATLVRCQLLVSRLKALQVAVDSNIKEVACIV